MEILTETVPKYLSSLPVKYFKLESTGILYTYQTWSTESKGLVPGFAADMDQTLPFELSLQGLPLAGYLRIGSTIGVCMATKIQMNGGNLSLSQQKYQLMHEGLSLLSTVYWLTFCPMTW